MEKVAFILGSNLNDRITLLQQAINRMEESLGSLIATSHFYETPPWGFNSDNSFFNVSVIIETNKNPYDVLKTCLAIEKNLGRVRKNSNSTQKYEDRPIDIDIVLWEKKIIKEEQLSVPHIHLRKRQFVLIPLNEIASDWIINDYPQTTVKKALQELQNKEGLMKVKKIENVNVI